VVFEGDLGISSSKYVFIGHMCHFLSILTATTDPWILLEGNDNLKLSNITNNSLVMFFKMGVNLRDKYIFPLK
jgi:hypothetical protein